ncbi:MAG TPA: hypothetical protein VIG88_05280 [Lysobacter sp.]
MALGPHPLVAFLLAGGAIAAARLLHDGRWLGIDTGAANIAVLVLTAWGALFALGRAGPSTVENAVSPGEWRARIGTAFTAVAVAYVASKLYVFQGADLLRDPAVCAVTGTRPTLRIVAGGDARVGALRVAGIRPAPHDSDGRDAVTGYGRRRFG